MLDAPEGAMGYFTSSNVMQVDIKVFIMACSKYEYIVINLEQSS